MTERRFGRLTDAPATFVLVGGRVVDPDTGADATRDIAVVDGRIAAEAPSSAERIDARGCVVAPGLCDLHVHLREPGTEGETVASGARAAARGGFTTICAMPNTQPALDAADAVDVVRGAAEGGSCRVRVIGAATVGRGGARPTHLEALAAAGVVGVSDDGVAIRDDAVTAEVLDALARLALPLIEHAEEAVTAGGGVMRAGPTATRLGLPGWPAEAELRTVERDIALAETAGAHLHLTHVSTSLALDEIRRAKARGLDVTCDVTPHHLAMTDAWVSGSRRFAWDDLGDPATATSEDAYEGATRVNPPLPSRDDALALLAAVADGTVDAIATDHAPHPIERKLVPFVDAAPGMIGLETALSVALAAVEAGRLGLGRLIEALSTAPARIIGERRSLEVGEAADLVVFDPEARWRVEAGALASASTNTPLLGMELPGVVRLTVADGRITFRADR